MPGCSTSPSAFCIRLQNLYFSQSLAACMYVTFNLMREENASACRLICARICTCRSLWLQKCCMHACASRVLSYHTCDSKPQTLQSHHLAAHAMRRGRLAAAALAASIQLLPLLRIQQHCGAQERHIKGLVLYAPLTLAALLVLWAQPCCICQEHLPASVSKLSRGHDFT